MRLAICEEAPATSRVPKSCIDFVPSATASFKSASLRITASLILTASKSITGKFCYQSTSNQQIESCLSSLILSLQFLTSFSDSDQNIQLLYTITMTHQKSNKDPDFLHANANVTDH
jgi:hypothetical protein